MKSLINFTLILVSLLFAAPALSQSVEDVRINEIQIHNSEPGNANNIKEEIRHSERFGQAKPLGTINVIILVTVLILLFFGFKYMKNHHIKSAAKKMEMANADQIENGKMSINKEKGALTYEELAAISIALYKYVEDRHDNERMLLTINAVSKAYSPWSSKIYTLRQIPNKK